jgi:DNA-binding transcriptional regulator YdaS (Cro superfamily)
MNLKTYLQKSERGAIAQLAKAISGHASDVSDWAREKRPIPPKRCVAIEQATAGKVTRKDLRPHDWADHWPELAQPEPYLQTK